MIDIAKVNVGDCVYSGPNGEYLCKILEITNGDLICNMFSNITKDWVPVRLRLEPKDCFYE
jgi:hypothetical protein